MYLQKGRFMAFLFSGLFNSTCTTYSTGRERWSVSYVGRTDDVVAMEAATKKGRTSTTIITSNYIIK